MKGCTLCTLIKNTASSVNGAGSDLGDGLLGVACYANWKVDGRRLPKADSTDKNKSEQHSVARTLTRRIYLSWENQLLEDCYVVLLAHERHSTTPSDKLSIWGSESLFLGRKIEGHGYIQARINSWLDLCRESHGGLCNPRNYALSRFEKLLKHSYFGLVDVINMQLTELPFTSNDGLGPYRRLRPVPFAALSYVWEADPGFETKLENVHKLRMHGGIEEILYSLPRAIRDSMALVRRLGLRYLWVDRLCIVQNSTRSWKLNAYNMDTIYGNAALTICAADGQDARNGLMAMSILNDVKQPEIADYAEGVRLLATRPPEMLIKKSKWNSRAWIFQERLLSRRCLIFVGGRVYFQCRSTGMSEDIYSDRESTGWSLDFVDAPMQVFWQASERAFWVYIRVAELYSSRNLSKPKDMLAAFSGIANILQRTMRAPLIFGLPTSHFDLALLWQHVSAARPRKPRNDAEKKDYGDLEFPSWSWIGWMHTTITYSSDMLGGCFDNASEWLKSHTWVRWYARDGHGDLTPLWSAPNSLESRYVRAGLPATPRVEMATPLRGSSVWQVDRSTDARWRGYGEYRTSGGDIMAHHSKRSPNRENPFAGDERSRAFGERRASYDGFGPRTWREWLDQPL